jgi:hypothetical protein
MRSGLSKEAPWLHWRAILNFTMREYIMSHFKLEHLLCGLILISRIGDIGSTYLVTPSLKLEANPIARKLGWKFAWLTLLVCLVPYYSTALGVVVLVPSLLVSASNTSKIWFIRAYGESEYQALVRRLAKGSKLSHALAAVMASALFIALAALVLLFLCPDQTRDWGYWFGIGLMTYAFAIALHQSLAFVRSFRTARQDQDSISRSSPPKAAD